MNAAAPSSAAPQRGQVPHFNFILQPEFPLNALVLASDALRIANQNSGRRLFSWSFVSETGEAVHASNGMWFGVDCAVEAMPIGTAYIVFAGNLPTQRNSPRLLGHLRAAARFGAMIGSVDTGAFALAQAGLVGGEDAPEIVLHWEAEPTLRERFPAAQPLNQLYLLTSARAQCAGGVAALDMLLDLVGRLAGEALANEVANALVHTRRPATVAQRSDASVEAGRNSISRRLFALMERNLDFPLSLLELADELRIAPRTLSHLCKQVFGESPMRLYLRIRLQAARNFLFYEEFSIKAVSNACGFSYPAVFSRVFKSQFGQTPREFRARLRRDQNMAMRPEIRRLISFRS
jgi:AraC family carnitine catabolism transcriptional activator